MKRRAVVLLVVSAAAFFAWVGYLAFLALTSRNPVVLSHPQFLVANLWVVADVEALDKPVKVIDVAYAADGVKAPEDGAALDVPSLAKCDKYWTAPGRYILPLVAPPKGDYRVAEVPPSPGYPGGPPRIYPATPQTREQLAAMPKP